MLVPPMVAALRNLDGCAGEQRLGDRREALGFRRSRDRSSRVTLSSNSTVRCTPWTVRVIDRPMRFSDENWSGVIRPHDASHAPVAGRRCEMDTGTT